jgi:hypothetical protein
MHEIIVGILFIVAGGIGASVVSADASIFFVLGGVVVGIGLIWNGVGRREREKNKPHKPRVDLNAP